MTIAITWGLLGSAALLVFVYMTVWFVASLVFRRADIADIAWGLGFVVISAWLLVRPDAPGNVRQWIVTALVALWGLRLAWHVARRNLRPGHGEDARYAAWRRSWGATFVVRSYLQVFLLQGLFMLLIALPVLVSGSARGSETGVFDVLGLGIWLVGFASEAFGDAQLAAFLSEPSNRGHIMDRGLWGWTRHPNYFGEATMWWGLAVIALGVPGGWIAFVGPLTITWLLLKVSGVPLLEKSKAGQPEWEDYKSRTSIFFPLPPRRR